MTSDSAPDPSTAVDHPTEARLRRAPRIGVFLVLGGVLGLVATLVVTSLFPADPAVGFLASFGYFCLFGIPVGVLLGAIVALMLDAVSQRRARTVGVESQRVEPERVEPDPVEPDAVAEITPAEEDDGPASSARQTRE